MDYAKLNAALKAEYEDVILYIGFYKESDNAIFRDIAREEYTHAKHLKDILQSAGMLDAAPELEAKAKAAIEQV